DHARTQNGFEPFLDAGDVLLRHRTPDDIVFEFEGRAGRRRLRNDLDRGELAGTAGLLLVRIFVLDALGYLLAESDLRRADIGVDLVGALQDVDLDVEMQLAHALEDGLTALLIGRDAERRILGCELGKRDAELFLVRFRFRL